MESPLRRVWKITLIVMLATVTLLLTVRLRVVQGIGRAHVLCRSEECVLFVSEELDGWNRPVWDYGAGLLKSILGAADSPTHISTRERVFRISATGVQQFSFWAYVYPFEIFRDGIYGGGKGGPYRWTGSGFRLLTPDEMRALDAARKQGLSLYGDFSDKQGWTSKTLNAAEEFTYDLAGEKILLSMHYQRMGSQSLELRRGSGSGETIWALDDDSFVNEKTYSQLFDPAHLTGPFSLTQPNK